MRFGVPQDIARRARFDEGLENQAMGGILGSRIELSVREGPRAAQAKLDIALGVEDTLLKKEVNRLRAAKCRVTTLDKQGLKARFGKGEGGKEAGTTSADNDGTLLGRIGDRGGERGHLAVYHADTRAVTFGDAVERFLLEAWAC